MKKIVLAALLFFVCPFALGQGQNQGGSGGNTVGSGVCAVNCTSTTLTCTDTATNYFYYCPVVGSPWVQIGTSAGAVAFSSLTNGTAASKTFGVGASSTLTPSSTGIISANEVNGATVPASTTIVGTNSSNQIVDASAATLANNTTGTAAKWTTARNLAGNSVDGSANVAFSNKFIVQGASDAGLSGAQFLGRSEEHTSELQSRGH